MDSPSTDAPYSTPPTVSAARFGQALTLLFSGIGALLGYVTVENGWLGFSHLPAEIPAPHVIPKAPGGTALHRQMIDDILCERFDRPGRAWYLARNRLRQQALDAADAQRQPDDTPTLEYLALFDDLSAGFDLIGEPAKGIEVQQRKLAAMAKIEKAWIERQVEITSAANAGRPVEADFATDTILALYRTYANLGTHLIHAYLPAALRGDREARSRVAEGLGLLKLAVAINPDAHFGREKWQIVAGEYFLAVIDRQELLTKYDIVGNEWLAAPVKEGQPETPDWRFYYAALSDPASTIANLRGPPPIDDPNRAKLRAQLRSAITPTGAEGTWREDLVTIHEKPVPWDEPTLGILGMWTLGGGASPHFALAIGGILERVGDHPTAWRAYERAKMLAERFSPDPAIRSKFTTHCDERQKQLLEALRQSGISPDEATLRSEFQQRLKEGLAHRAELDQFEEGELAHGLSPDDPTFYDAWREKHEKQLPPQGLDLVPSGELARRSSLDVIAGILLLAGAGALLGQLIARYAFRA